MFSLHCTLKHFVNHTCSDIHAIMNMPHLFSSHCDVKLSVTGVFIKRIWCWLNTWTKMGDAHMSSSFTMTSPPSCTCMVVETKGLCWARPTTQDRPSLSKRPGLRCAELRKKAAHLHKYLHDLVDFCSSQAADSHRWHQLPISWHSHVNIHTNCNTFDHTHTRIHTHTVINMPRAFQFSCNKLAWSSTFGLQRCQPFCKFISLHHAHSRESNEGHESNQETGITRRPATNEGNESHHEGNQEAVGQVLNQWRRPRTRPSDDVLKVQRQRLLLVWWCWRWRPLRKRLCFSDLSGHGTDPPQVATRFGRAKRRRLGNPLPGTERNRIRHQIATLHACMKGCLDSIPNVYICNSAVE